MNSSEKAIREAGVAAGNELLKQLGFSRRMTEADLDPVATEADYYPPGMVPPEAVRETTEYVPPGGGAVVDETEAVRSAGDESTVSFDDYGEFLNASRTADFNEPLPAA